MNQQHQIYIATIYSQSSSVLNGPVVGANKTYILEKLVNAHCVSAVLAVYLGSQIYEMFMLCGENIFIVACK